MTKADSMRKIVEHIDKQHWRTLEFFRMLDKNNTLQLESQKVTSDILVRELVSLKSYSYY